MGNPDLTPQDRRGLVIFPAESRPMGPRPAREWWLVPTALILAAVMIAIAFAIR